jgi:hypothetical protein
MHPGKFDRLLIKLDRRAAGGSRPSVARKISGLAKQHAALIKEKTMLRIG